MDELSPKEALFVNFYLTTNFNAKRSATLAGYSEASAHELGSRLLKKVEVRRAIDSYLNSDSVSRQEVLYRLGELARNRATDYVLEDGTLDIKQMKEDGMLWLIKSVRKLKNGRVAYQLHDSQKALETIAKIQGMLTEGMSVTVNVNEEIEKHNELTQKLRDLRNKIVPPNTEMSLQEYLAYFSTTKGNTNATNHK